MVFDILRSKDQPHNPVCVVDVDASGAPNVNCNIDAGVVRSLLDRERVCIIEFDGKTGRPYSYCGSGKDVVSRIWQVRVK